MDFSQQLNAYMEQLDCTAKRLSQESGVSAATLSRYRSGERVPERDSDTFAQLCAGLARIAAQQHAGLTREALEQGFAACSDVVTADREQLRRNFNTLVGVLNINLTRMSQQTNYDPSTIFRIRSGSRQIAEPVGFAAAIAQYVAREWNTAADREVLAELLGCPAARLEDEAERCKRLRHWLMEEQPGREDVVSRFLNRLDEFDLNEYIRAIHFDEMKVPPAVPFQLPTSRAYFGLQEMMESELDFLKATVLSRSMEPVTMYSDMPMGEMSKDPEFPKKWMFGMGMMLKKGLHLNQIHSMDRSFEDMMLGLESWVPMYMTGQVSPYYLKGKHNGVFLHLLKVSGAAALSGEAIAGGHSDGRYYLTKAREELAYYRKRAQQLLDSASPLMDIYREDRAVELKAFLRADAAAGGRRRNILSSLPLYTMDADDLDGFLQRRQLPEPERQEILAFAAFQRELAEQTLAQGTIEQELPLLSREEFERYPMLLSLAGLFRERDLPYTWEEYEAHLAQTRQFEASHPGYTLVLTKGQPFRNLQIIMHEGRWAMVSKNKAPAIHFVIHHPKLCGAIENFIPPVIEP